MMDRRKALKNMGLAMGYTVATPTLISIMQSCKGEQATPWVPIFFSKEQGDVLVKLIDVILPKTDTPSASEVQVHLFIDKFVDEVFKQEDQGFLLMSMGSFMDKALKDSSKETIADLIPEDLETVLAIALKVTEEEETTYQDSIKVYREAVEEGGQATLTDDASRFAFANNLRDMTIWGYKTSEYVGENVLSYLPVPGEYIACGDMQELTEGKAWSI